MEQLHIAEQKLFTLIARCYSRSPEREDLQRWALPAFRAVYESSTLAWQRVQRIQDSVHILTTSLVFIVSSEDKTYLGDVVVNEEYKGPMPTSVSLRSCCLAGVIPLRCFVFWALVPSFLRHMCQRFHCRSMQQGNAQRTQGVSDSRDTIHSYL